MARRRSSGDEGGVVSTEMASYVFLSSLITLYKQHSARRRSQG